MLTNEEREFLDDVFKQENKSNEEGNLHYKSSILFYDIYAICSLVNRETLIKNAVNYNEKILVEDKEPKSPIIYNYTILPNDYKDEKLNKWKSENQSEENFRTIQKLIDVIKEKSNDYDYDLLEIEERSEFVNLYFDDMMFRDFINEKINHELEEEILEEEILEELYYNKKMRLEVKTKQDIYQVKMNENDCKILSTAKNKWFRTPYGINEKKYSSLGNATRAIKEVIENKYSEITIEINVLLNGKSIKNKI